MRFNADFTLVLQIFAPNDYSPVTVASPSPPSESSFNEWTSTAPSTALLFDNPSPRLIAKLPENVIGVDWKASAPPYPTFLYEAVRSVAPKVSLHPPSIVLPSNTQP